MHAAFTGHLLGIQPCIILLYKYLKYFPSLELLMNGQ